MSETETRSSQNAFDSEMRQRPSKSDLETKTNLEYYNTNFKFDSLQDSLLLVMDLITPLLRTCLFK